MKLINFIIIFLILLISPSRAEQSVYDPQERGVVSAPMGGPVIQELSLQDVDMAEAIRIIAEKSGFNIVLGQDVKGSVTVFLKRVGAREALRIVLESQGLAFSEEDGIIHVMTQDVFKSRFGFSFGQDEVSRMIKLNFLDPVVVQNILDEVKSATGKVVVNADTRSVLIIDNMAKVQAMERLLSEVDVPITSAVMTLLNVRAESLLPEVRKLLTQSIGSVEVNSEENTLQVTDTPLRIEKVRKAVANMDARGRAVILEVKMIHVVLNDEHRNGVDWTGILDDYQRMRLVKKYDFLVGTDFGRALSLGMIRKDDFPTLIEALDTVGYVQEYQLSTIRVTGSEKVKMVVRLDDPSVDLSLIEENAGSAPFVPQAQASLTFVVKASPDAAGEVLMTIVPQETSLDKIKAEWPLQGHVVGGNKGYTAVVGGMIVSERIAAGHKIPLLGDLPLVGFAFRMDGLVRKEEFVVFLTPKSVSLSQILADDPLNFSVDGVLTGAE